MDLGAIGYNGQDYIQAAGKNTQAAGKTQSGIKAGNKSEAAEHTDFSLKYVQAGSRKKVFLDPEALFSNCHAQSGESINVYRAEEFSGENPLYLIKGTDCRGNEYEEKIDVSKVNPHNCSYKEMVALGVHTGQKSDELFLSMSILKDKAAKLSYSDKADWISLLDELKNDMKTLGRWDSYMRYDKIINGVLAYFGANTDSIAAWHAETKNTDDKNGDNEKNTGTEHTDSETESEIIVRADGSKVLMMTTHIGGAETMMSIQISGPSELQNSQTPHSKLSPLRQSPICSSDESDESNRLAHCSRE
ncbi:MAG: hypothetical protein NC433_05550 [Clostridiales bacterium]|nr:hypothetical protein [Clostridiales bacterium]